MQKVTFQPGGTNDHSTDTVPYVPGDEPGEWRLVPPATEPVLPQYQFVTPFTMTSPDQFRGEGPYALDSAAWATDYNEVKDYGSATSTVRSAFQTDEARFWAEIAQTVILRVIRQMAADQGMDLWQAGQAFALVSMSFIDGLVSCWDAKWHWYFWRPYWAIREGDTDGNDATVADPAWNTLLRTPAHPEHPSAHACVTGAAQVPLEALFGDDVGFYATSSGLPGQQRWYDNWADLVQRSGDGRVWAGLHYRHSVNVGTSQGHDIGTQLMTFLPRVD